MKDTEVIKIVNGYLREKGFNPERLKSFDESAPDFKVNYDDGGLFYCEVKSPNMFIKNAEFEKHSTKFSKLEKHLHKAAKQFRNANPLHLFPNILIWTSKHFALCWKDFSDCFRGFISIDNKIIYDRTNSDSFKRVRKDWEIIDIHIWLQLGKTGIYQESKFINSNSLNILSPKLLPLLGI